MRYRVRRDVKTLAEIGGKVGAGEIIVHKTGNLLLNCPECGKIQFATAKLEGSDEAPDIMTPIQCGSGYCHRCGVWFRIVTGQSETIEMPPERKPVDIPEKLQRAGVKRPPEQPR